MKFVTQKNWRTVIIGDCEFTLAPGWGWDVIEGAGVQACADDGDELVDENGECRDGSIVNVPPSVFDDVKNANAHLRRLLSESREIHFYRANEKPYGPFSNLYRCEVVFEGVTYPTSEHAYQAGKAAKPEVRAWLLAAPTPALCAMAAHGLYKWDVVPNWADIKLDRMRAVLRAKFEQHPELAVLLASTGDARIVETGTTPNAVNRFWGEVDGKGQNMLGVMLMELREDLKRDRPSGAQDGETAS